MEGEPCLSRGIGKSLELPLSGSSSKIPDILFKRRYTHGYNILGSMYKLLGLRIRAIE